MNNKAVKITRIRTCDPAFDESLSLMHASFVDDELRPDDALRANTDNCSIFSFNTIENKEGSRVGLMTTWNFGKIIYIEHFAIERGMRGQGYGSAAIDKLAELSKQPIIIEVEMPETSEEAAARVKFYERLGFTGWQTPYVQPPYSKGKNAIPMMLMSKGMEETLECAGIVTALLHRHVYGIKNGAHKAD